MWYDTSRRFYLRPLPADSAIAPSYYFSLSFAACCASVRASDCLEKVVLAQWVAWNNLAQLCSLWSTRKHNFASFLYPTAVIFMFQSFSTCKSPFWCTWFSCKQINHACHLSHAGQTSRAAGIASPCLSGTICACCVLYCRSQTAWSPCPCCADCCMACHGHWHEHIRVSSCCFLSAQWDQDNETLWLVQVLRGKNVLKKEKERTCTLWVDPIGVSTLMWKQCNYRCVSKYIWMHVSVSRPRPAAMTHPAFPTYSLYSPQQLLWLQHMYARQYYMQ